MRAAIDLGSNSAILLVMRGDDVVLDRVEVVGLGRGLEPGGGFREDRMAAALQVLRSFGEQASVLGVQPSAVRAMATSASRRASNAAAFFRQLREETGLEFAVISGEEEARLTFLGSKTGGGEAAVIDLGGGSTEIAIGDQQLAWRHSFELGSVRLTEQVLGEQVRVATAADVEAMERRVVFDVPGPARAIGVAGSVTTLAAASLGLTVWDAQQVHGAVLTDVQLRGFQHALIGLDAVQRRGLFAVGGERADYLLAGATILRGALAALGQASLTVSVRGLRYGALQDSNAPQSRLAVHYETT